MIVTMISSDQGGAMVTVVAATRARALLGHRFDRRLPPANPVDVSRAGQVSYVTTQDDSVYRFANGACENAAGDVHRVPAGYAVTIGSPMVLETAGEGARTASAVSGITITDGILRDLAEVNAKTGGSVDMASLRFMAARRLARDRGTRASDAGGPGRRPGAPASTPRASGRSPLA